MYVTDTLPGTITVHPHHQGPDGVVNGGWAAGLVAGLLSAAPRDHGAPVEVTLRAPVPLGAPLVAEVVGEFGLLRAGDGSVVAEAVRVPDIAAPPPFVEPAAAVRAGRIVPVDHPFPRCFVCGPDRRDGLRVTVGPTGDGALFAGAWTPPQPDGIVPDRYLWAVLDCPTGWVHFAPDSRAVLGRLTVSVREAAPASQPYVVTALATGAERRKRYSVAALYHADGRLVASSAATWITA